jgi:predicted phage baseplate assembly protein
MPLPDIQLDDLTFEQIASELIRRIPAYTPEWTDHNDSDPGITLIQLFSWLAEIIIYRLNQVPQKNYYAFLQLLGVSLNLPTAAKAELTFTLSSPNLSAGVPIPGGTPVQAAASAGGSPVIFETDVTFLAVGLSLAQVQVYDGAQYQVVTIEQTSPGVSFAPFSNQPQPNAALYLGFTGAFPPGQQNRLTIHASATGAPAPVQVGPDLTGSSLPPVVAYWEYWAGTTSGWQQITVVSDTTNYFTRSGVVLFDAPAAGAHVASQVGALQRPTDPTLYWIRNRIDQILGPGYETTPMLSEVLVNTVTATNAVPYTNELLGASNGLPNQSFTLANVPVLPAIPPLIQPPVIQVNENDGNGYVPWTQVPDFASSRPSEKVYTLDYSSGTVTFGDGINGKIPAFFSGDQSNQFASDVPNIRAASYQSGGGSAGNVGANTITTLNTVIPYVGSVTNLQSAAGGADEESVADASDRVPAILTTQYRAVTAQDFADIALMTPNAQIVRAFALPLFNPNLSVANPPAQGSSAAVTYVPLPGVVTVLVIPYSTNPAAIPSAQTLQLVANWLDSHRLITTEVYVQGPNYRQVQIQVSVIADPTYALATVTQALTNQLLTYFNPLTGGADGTGWAFGATIYASETEREILITQGVLRIVSGTLLTYVDGALQTGDVSLAPSEVVYSINHLITVTYS